MSTTSQAIKPAASQGVDSMTADRPNELVRVRDVTLQYKTPNHLVTATYQVSCTVERGDRYVILGPSGCGKSTLLKAIGGFVRPVAGSIVVNGREVEGPGPDRTEVFHAFEQLMPRKC